MKILYNVLRCRDVITSLQACNLTVSLKIMEVNKSEEKLIL